MKATIYSFKNLIGVFSSVAYGKQIVINGTSGGLGIGQIIIRMANDITTHEIGMDGAVIPFAIPVNNGTISIQCQQTSMMHQILLDWYNTIISQATTSNDVTNWANTSMILQNTDHSNSHHITGISPKINPEKTYSAQGGNVTWELMAANIESVN